MPKGMSPRTRRDYKTTKDIRKKIKESGRQSEMDVNRAKDMMKGAGTAGLAGVLAKIKVLEKRIKKMKTMSPGERKARTGSATGRLSVDNMPKPGMSNFRKRRKMLAEGSLIPKGKKRK
jgi:hypothetical protein